MSCSEEPPTLFFDTNQPESEQRIEHLSPGGVHDATSDHNNRPLIGTSTNPQRGRGGGRERGRGNQITNDNRKLGFATLQPHENFALRGEVAESA